MRWMFSCGAVVVVLSITCGIQREGATAAQPATELPAEFARVLRDYENGWRAKDAAALANLFAEDGFVLSSHAPPVRGRAAIQQKYTGSGGPLHLRALAWEKEGAIGYIIGEYAQTPEFTKPGKFTLTLKSETGGKWLIMSDMDNGNEPPAPRPAAQPTRTPAEEADRGFVIAAGMTEGEADCWELAAKTAGAFFDLPELHPMDRQEIASAIHIVQNKLLSRPTYRAYLEKAKAPAEAK